MVLGYKNVRIPIKLCVLVQLKNDDIIIVTGHENALNTQKGGPFMALSNLAGWTEGNAASACGTSCGASDKPAETPAACGSGDKPKEKPAACGSACGAGGK